MIQVNGKLRGKISVAVDADNATVEQAALANSNIQQILTAKHRKK
jgi:leucyl-tRNA synthetase